MPARKLSGRAPSGFPQGGVRGESAAGLLRGDVPVPRLVIDEGGALEGTSHDFDNTTDKDSAPINRTGSLDAVASRSS